MDMNFYRVDLEYIDFLKNFETKYRGFILITNKTVDKKSSYNPYMQDYARFFVQFLIGS